MKFADVKNDVAFRKIFGNDKKTAALISFLNAALELEGDHRVVSVTIANPYQFPRIAGEKATILDVRATDQAGRKFVVEMQVADKTGFGKRVQYYTSRDYSMQINKDEDYPLLNPTYFIGILNFNFRQSKHYHTRHLILEKKSREHLLDDIQFSFIELEKFNKSMKQLKTPIDKWTYFIKNAESLEVIPDFAQDDPGLKEAFIEADKHTWKKEEVIAYDNVSIREQDERGEKEKVRIDAKNEGREEKEREMIIKLFEKGNTAETISDLLDIPLERVKKVIEEYKNK